MDAQIIITLLTITVILLSVVIVALLVLAIVVLVKLKQLAKRADKVTNNLAAATEWMVPAKLFYEARRIFRK
jgi:hypothetical protein